MKQLLPLLLLAGCSGTIVQDRPDPIKIPVSVPCVKDKPAEVSPLRDRMSKAEWDALTTDQREKLLLGQGMDRKAYGDQLFVATAGCP